MTPEPQLDMAQVAALLGVGYATVKRYRAADRARFAFPDPDGVIGRSPWWWQSTITRWAAGRPGQGARPVKPAKKGAGTRRPRKQRET